MRAELVHEGRYARRDGLFSFGNSKLDKTIAIFNLTPALHCSAYHLGLCPVDGAVCQDCGETHGCYGVNAECGYSTDSALPYRLHQADWWDRATPEEIAEALTYHRRRTIDYLRLDEVGDFRHQADVDKAVQLAELLWRRGIGTAVYTARRDLRYTARGRLVVNGSGFMVDNRVDVVCRHAPSTCPGSCRDCKVCYEPNQANVTISYHGFRVRRK